MSEVNSLFFNTFVGEYVQVILNLMSKQEVVSEEGAVADERPMMIIGFFLDSDDTHHYFGPNPDNVTDAVLKEYCVHWKIMQPVNPMDDILDGMEPEGGMN